MMSSGRTVVDNPCQALGAPGSTCVLKAGDIGIYHVWPAKHKIWKLGELQGPTNPWWNMIELVVWAVVPCALGDLLGQFGAWLGQHGAVLCLRFQRHRSVFGLMNPSLELRTFWSCVFRFFVKCRVVKRCGLRQNMESH